MNFWRLLCGHVSKKKDVRRSFEEKSIKITFEVAGTGKGGGAPSKFYRFQARPRERVSLDGNTHCSSSPLSTIHQQNCSKKYLIQGPRQGWQLGPLAGQAGQALAS